MGAKITLIGAAKGVQRQNNLVSFHMVTGPATDSPPKGLKLFGQVTYCVQCTQRQWNRARAGDDDSSDLIVEGYCQPQQEPSTGKLYIAVVALSLRSTRKQHQKKLQQLADELQSAKVVYQEAKTGGATLRELEALAERLVKAHESVENFLERHPELGKPEGPR
jgi:hypothetical protein